MFVLKAMFWASTRSHAEKPDNARELENTRKPDIHGALVAQWTCPKVMKEQCEKTSVFTHFVRISRILFCIPEHLFSFALKLLSVYAFRFCSRKNQGHSRTKTNFKYS